MRRATLLLALVAAAAGCDWSLHRMQKPIRCGVDQATTLLPDNSCNLVPPEGTVSMEPPFQAPPLTRGLLLRGRDRFDRFCAPCHGLAANGDSYVARAMTLRRPPTLVDRIVSGFPDQRILDVIAHGYGLMPEYASALPPADRYAILQYLRALQGREVSLDELPPAQQQEAKSWLR